MMRSAFRFLLPAILLLFTAHRLPAPISEVPESPTPAPEKQANTKKAPSKSRGVDSKPRATPPPQPSATQGSVRFAGIWTGALHGATNGTVITLVVTPNEQRATVKGLEFWGDRSGNASRAGNTLSWKFLAERWTLTAAPDGKTATVTGRHWPSGSSSGTLTKTQ